MKFVAKRRLFFVALFVAAFAGLLAWAGAMQYSRPIPEVTLVESASFTWEPPASSEIAWPELGQASAAVAGVGTIGESPAQQPQPIASLTKMMTAYLVLKERPLAPGEPGPEVQFQEHHVADYLARRANDESVVPVTAGATMSQRDLLRGLLLASGNNLADVLAEWTAGSVEAFVARMNEEARTLGMHDTFYADAAGLDPRTVSTAHDQLLLAQAAMANPTFAQIVRETEANLPGAGIVYNTNSQLGKGGIVGIKTGWTEEAGACFVFAAEWQVEGGTQLILGAVLGQPTLEDAFARSQELILTSGLNTQLVRLASQGETLGHLQTRWGSTTDAVLGQDVSLVMIPGLDVHTELTLLSSENIEPGSEIGVARITAGAQVVEVPLVASSGIDDPDLLWRLTRLD